MVLEGSREEQRASSNQSLISYFLCHQWSGDEGHILGFSTRPPAYPKPIRIHTSPLSFTRSHKVPTSQSPPQSEKNTTLAQAAGLIWPLPSLVSYPAPPSCWSTPKTVPYHILECIICMLPFGSLSAGSRI